MANARKKILFIAESFGAAKVGKMFSAGKSLLTHFVKVFTR
jgi:hypothetical protein